MASSSAEVLVIGLPPDEVGRGQMIDSRTTEVRWRVPLWSVRFSSSAEASADGSPSGGATTGAFPPAEAASAEVPAASEVRPLLEAMAFVFEPHGRRQLLVSRS